MNIETLNMQSPMAMARVVRKERYAWPGGYELALLMEDGGILCAECVEKEFANISYSVRNGIGDGWLPMAYTHTAELEEPVFCSHCGHDFFGDE